MRNLRPYDDRVSAGHELAEAVLDAVDPSALVDPVVLALPRGGVPVAAVLAERLGAELDVLLVRKVGVPGHREYGIGAVSEEGVTLIDHDRARRAGVDEASLRAVVDEERAELARRGRAYRSGGRHTELTGRDVFVVDDGVATGVSAGAALRVARARRPWRLFLAVPVGAPSALADLADVVDDVICPLRPPAFRAVGEWYRDFRQVTDDEVVEALRVLAV